VAEKRERISKAENVDENSVLRTLLYEAVGKNYVSLH
jgi:hypothetical protein